MCAFDMRRIYVGHWLLSSAKADLFISIDHLDVSAVALHTKMT